MDKNELTVNLEQDLNEISGLIWKYMDDKYLREFKNKIQAYKQNARQNMSKEAQFLQALIPFMPNESKVLDKMLEAVIYNDMIEKGFTEYKELSTLYRDENKEREQIKKLMYKLILFKLIQVIESVSKTNE